MSGRALIITGRYPPAVCGIGDYSHRLVKELASHSFECAVFTSADGSSAKTLSSKTPGVLREASRWDASDCRTIVQRVEILRPSLVHIQYHAAAFLWNPAITLLPQMLKRRFPRLKVVVTLHELAGPGSFYPAFIRRGWLFLLLVFCNAVIVTNRRDEGLLRLIPFLRKKLHRIPIAPAFDRNSVGPSERGTIRARLGIGDREFLVARFGFVHNLRASRIPLLLQAVHLLAQKGLPAKLLLLGFGSDADRRRVGSFADRFQVRDRVLLTGYLSPMEVSRHLAAVDVAVQLYPEGANERRSSLQTVLAHGVPVVTTRKSALPDSFRQRENLLFAAAETPSAVAQALSDLFLDRPLLERLQDQAPTALSGMDWASIAHQTLALYQSLSQ